MIDVTGSDGIAIDAESIFRGTNETGNFVGQAMAATFGWRPRRRWDQWTSFLLSLQDNAGLVWFRVGFGLLTAFWALSYLGSDRISTLFRPGQFHFTYVGFQWVKPWSPTGMTLQFVVMMLSGLLIATGALYRAAALVFACCFTHFFLIDKTNYQNHYYLICLLSWLMCLLPANRACSIDVLNGSVRLEREAPRWTLWLLRFHIAVPYIYGGFAKFEADWLSSVPMQNMLASRKWPDALAPFLQSSIAADLLTWGGLAFDVLIVPLMMWRKTRILAFSLSIVFHLSNAFLFPIHVFPWFMIFATTIFFPPASLQRFLPFLNSQPLRQAEAHPVRHRRTTAFVVPVLAVWCLFHLAWPFRHFAFEGPASWTEQGHYFSWRMMLRGKTSGIRYSITDPKTGDTWTTDTRRMINNNQSSRFARDPAMILDLAHHLANGFEKKQGSPVEVRALVLTSLNGRKPQLLIDPEVNLAAISRLSSNGDWIMPLIEPLRQEPWTVPLNDWERHVDLSKYSLQKPQFSIVSELSAGTR